MHNGKKVIVVMPAYNAENTLIRTYEEVVEQHIVDLVIIVDDASEDNTIRVAQSLEGKVIVHQHQRNLGYGGNQKTCYKLALKEGADIVIMVHPDYQYTPKLIPAMATMIGNGLYDCALGSRILTGNALKGGMPIWKYVVNRFLTLFENVMLNAQLSEYHTGFRAFSRDILERLPLEVNSNDFLFDNQMLAQIIWFGFSIGEVSCPASYHKEASSVSFMRGIPYGLGCLKTSVLFRLARWGVVESELFPRPQRME